MAICSFEFMLFCLSLVTLNNLLPRKWQRQALLIICSLAFLFPWVPNPSSWIAFFVFMAGSFAVLKVSRKTQSAALLGITIAVGH